MKLWELQKDQAAYISGFIESVPKIYFNRLNELGFQIGVEVVCQRQSPFGGPKVYQIGDDVFSMAKDVASCVTVEIGE